MKTLIGVAASVPGRYSAFTECLANLQKPHETEVMFATGIDIGANRNKIVRHALEQKFSEVWFVDDDMTFRKEQLWDLLRHQKPVVASLYVNRKPPHGVMAFNETAVIDGKRMWKPVSLAGAPETGLAEIIAAGTGGMLIQTEVFKAIEYDTWFDHFQSTDDLAFCQRVIDAGFPIFLDLGAKMGHITTHEVWPRYSTESWDWYVGYQLSETEEIKVELAP